MHAEPQAGTDEELASQAQAGSLSSFEELVYRYEARIYRFVRNSCRNESDAQEVTQDTFVSAFRNIGQFDLNRSFATWLFAIARHKCIDRHRANRVVIGEQTAELLDEDDPSLFQTTRCGKDLWHRRAGVAGAAVSIRWLRYAEDMNVRDIARVLHKTKRTSRFCCFARASLLGANGRSGKLAREPRFARK
jgi:RNA polymerase sigma-70 factor (ECF subfamily)